MIMDESRFAQQAFDRAAADLGRVLHAVAARYRMRGAPLTWRLMHEIESEALADLGLPGRHSPELLQMFVRSPEDRYPCSDEPVRFVPAQVVPLIFRFVIDVYGLSWTVAGPAPRAHMPHAAAPDAASAAPRLSGTAGPAPNGRDRDRPAAWAYTASPAA
jgi:hypothetical protein